MRKRYRVLLLAAMVAALVVPVGFALSLESPATRTQASYGAVAATTAVTASVLATPGHAGPAAVLPPANDTAKLLLVGTILLGLAAFVRKAV